MNTELTFDPIRLPPECAALRAEVRAFLAEASAMPEAHGDPWLLAQLDRIANADRVQALGCDRDADREIAA